MAINTNLRVIIKKAKVPGLALLLQVLLLASPVNAVQQSKLCFPPVVGAPWLADGLSDKQDACGQTLVSNAPPYLDGCVTGDPGWTGSLRYVDGFVPLPPTTSTSDFADVIIQGLREDGKYLYLSIESNNLDKLYDLSNDTYHYTFVIVGFDPGVDPITNIDGPKQLIQFAPIAFDYNTGNKNGGTLQYWTWRLGNGPEANIWNWRLGDPNNPPYPPSWLVNSSTGEHQIDKLAYPYPSGNNGSCTGNNGLCTWVYEMRFPIASDVSSGLVIPQDRDFKLYISVGRVVNRLYDERWWPPTSAAKMTGCDRTSPGVGICAIPGSVPNFNTAWGTATVAPNQQCGGVDLNLKWGDIYVSNAAYGDDNMISQKELSPGVFDSNTFHARVYNSTVDPIAVPTPPNLAPAKNVSATFFIANFGLPSEASWEQVPPVPPNPPSPKKDLPAGSTSQGTVLYSNPWIVPVDRRNDYDPNLLPASHPHQCIRAQLDSTPPPPSPNMPSNKTIFIRSSATQNMNIGNGSTFEQTAEISAKGYPPGPTKPDGAVPDQLFDLRIITRQEVLKPGAAGPVNERPVPVVAKGQDLTLNRGKEKAQVVSQFTWIAEGCRHTGKYLTDEGRAIELCDSVGSFGYVVRHTGNAPVEKWKVTLKLLDDGKNKLDEVAPPTHT